MTYIFGLYRRLCGGVIAVPKDFVALALRSSIPPARKSSFRREQRSRAGSAWHFREAQEAAADRCKTPKYAAAHLSTVLAEGNFTSLNC